jgi:PTH2 family peptidyl-tRNA hydrolase
LNDLNDELIQYIIVNKDLNMSAGKIATQVGHVCTICAYEEWFCNASDTDEFQKFNEWFFGDQKKIILGASQSVLEKLELQFYGIRDKGYTEIPENSLTAVSLGIMTKEEARPYIKRLQLLK